MCNYFRIFVLNMKKIYIFDLGGVLIKLNVNRCMRAFKRIMGEERMQSILGMDSRGEGVKAVSVASKQLMADFERGLLSSEAFIHDVLSFSHPGTTAEQVVEAWMSMLDELPQERLEVVDALRSKGHPVFLLSNGNDLHFEFINKTYALDTHFDELFLSQKMHIAKPEKEIYDAVDKRLNQLFGADKQVVFIDDLELNRQAAAQYVGWTTFSSVEEIS